MQFLGTGGWECVQCGRGLEPGDKECPSCGCGEARRRRAHSAPRINWSVMAACALVVAVGVTAYLVASHFGPKPPPTGEIVRHFRLGQELLQEGRYEEAIAELETVTGLAPDSIGGHHELARAYDAAGRHADALREMQLTLRLTMTDKTAARPTLDSEEADLRYELATLLAKNGEFAEAATELGKASRRDPSLEGSVDYNIALGIAQAGRGRSESARQALAGALATSPEVARQALTDWIAARPDGLETPLLERVLVETSAPTESASPAESPPASPGTDELLAPDAQFPQTDDAPPTTDAHR